MQYWSRLDALFPFLETMGNRGGGGLRKEYLTCAQAFRGRACGLGCVAQSECLHASVVQSCTHTCCGEIFVRCS
jgi:hypothetical protein